MKKRVYVIEDDPDIGELISFLLAERGYEVAVFGNIASFRKQEEARPSLLIIDVMLPDGNGLDICKAWKTNPDTQDIPVLVMSAYEDSRSDERARYAEGFISKPFDIQSFLKDVTDRLK